jgi:hypothetical protein
MTSARALLLLPPLLMGVPQPAPAATIRVGVCGQAGSVEIPVGPSDKRQDGCPTPCHAITCERSRLSRRAG